MADALLIDAFHDAAWQVGDQAAQAGLEPEDIAEIVDMKDAEFERIFGRTKSAVGRG